MQPMKSNYERYHLVHNSPCIWPEPHKICNIFSIRLPNLELEVFALPWMNKLLAIEVFSIPWFYVKGYCFLYCLEYIIMIGKLSWFLSFLFAFVEATQLPLTPYDDTWERVCPSEKNETFSMLWIQRCNPKQGRGEKMNDAIKFYISEKRRRHFKHSTYKVLRQKTCRVSPTQYNHLRCRHNHCNQYLTALGPRPGL